MAKKRKKDEEEEEKAYEVKDKRRVSPDGTLKEEPVEEPPAAGPAAQAPETEAAAAPPEAEAAERPEAEAPEQELPPPNIYATLGFMIGLLADQAWQFMGVRLPPGQKETFKDMAQAKIAIDTIVFITDKLHGELSEDERRAMRGLISDLQVNYVQHSG